MKLRKNLIAKLAAVAASLAALAAILGLVHQNPPPAGASSRTDAGAATAAQPTAGTRAQPQDQHAAARRHTRTHVS